MPPCSKPDACKGCPAYTWGPHWVPDEHVEGAEVLILGQNPGSNEEQGLKYVGKDGYGVDEYLPHPPAPYLGKTGRVMEQRFFPLAGLQRGKVDICNMVRCRKHGTNDLLPLNTKEMREIIQTCQERHFQVPKGIKLIVAEGEYALYATTGEDGSDAPGHKISRGLSGWRGWMLPYNPPPRPRRVHNKVYSPGPGDLPVLATYHLAYLFRNPWEETACQRDWRKVAQYLAGTWPESFPPLQVAPPTLWPPDSAFDTEFYEKEGRKVLTRYSMAYRDATKSPHVYVVEAQDSLILPQVPRGTRPHVIFHNADSDLESLNEILAGVEIDWDDTMYAHSVNWSDLDHDLDYLGSLYSRTNRWKHLLHTNPRQYSGGDGLGTWDVWQGLKSELSRDPRAWEYYRTRVLPLLPIIVKARREGIRLSQARVRESLLDLGAQAEDAELKAQAGVGWPINLGSPPQVSHWLYEVEQVHLNRITGRKLDGRRRR